MSNYSTEEEQIAALKNWWKENGNSLLIGVGAALAIVFGWKGYQNSVELEKSEASVLYQDLVTAATSNSFESTDDDTTVSYLASQLKEKHEDSEYGLYAALFIAKEAVTEGNLDEAVTQLEWAKGATEDRRLQHIIKARIARILSAQGKNDEALQELSASDAEFEPSFLEIQGDIKKRTGDIEGAINAYKKAFSLVKEEPQAQPLLAVKLSDLGINPETL